MKPIDLGFKAPDYGLNSPVAAESSDDDKEPKTCYPSLYLGNCPPELMGLESGDAIIQFKVVGKNMSERDGKKSCGLELEITSIQPKVMPKPEEEGESDTEAAFSEYEGSEK